MPDDLTHIVLDDIIEQFKAANPIINDDASLSAESPRAQSMLFRILASEPLRSHSPMRQPDLPSRSSVARKILKMSSPDDVAINARPRRRHLAQ